MQIENRCVIGHGAAVAERAPATGHLVIHPASVEGFECQAFTNHALVAARSEILIIGDQLPAGTREDSFLNRDDVDRLVLVILNPDQPHPLGSIVDQHLGSSERTDVEICHIRDRT